MKTFVATLALLVAGANALVGRGGTCCFSLTASGGASGTLGQLSDGQNRIGGGLPAAQYCIDSNGGITDGSGRGCILTPPTTQFQCDVGASPTTGFSVGCDGTLSYNGNSNFVACQTGDNGELNVYTTSGSGQTGCVNIELTASSCQSGCPAPSPTPAPPAPSPTTCPAALTGTYEFPHLIIPVNSASPNTAYGTSFNGEVTSTISSIFNFDIPAADSGKTCSLVFLFPLQSQLQTSSFTFSGDGEIDFSSLEGTASGSTTYANQPGVDTDLGVVTVAPGNSYTITTFPCPAGETVSFKLSEAGSTSLTYFQDFNPSPIGLYITVC